MTMLLTRLRVILPPDWSLIVFVVVYALFEGPLLYFEWWVGQPLNVMHPGVYIVRVAAFAFGAFRVRAFHPAYLPDYRIWLERSPWTSRKPLPAGPVAFGWEDALPIGTLAILAAARGPDEPFRMLTLALAGHLLFLSGAMARAGAAGYAFATAFGLGLIVRLWPDPRFCLAAAVGIYAIGWAGLRASLARFPWASLEGVKSLSMAEATRAMQEASCGWPFDQLQPRGAEAGRSSRGALIALSVLAGWYLFASLAVLPNPAGTVQFAFWNAIMALTLGRAATYCSGHAPPISLMGRLRNFRWIVPGYDQVFLAPICTILIGVLALDRFRPPGLDDESFLPAALTLACLVNATTGPSLVRWRLTGRHRITATVANKGNEFVQVG